jgi:hypothetical protein
MNSLLKCTFTEFTSITQPFIIHDFSLFLNKIRNRLQKLGQILQHRTTKIFEVFEGFQANKQIYSPVD